jgi:hypothetical protein
MTPEQIQQQEESELIWDVIDSAYHKEYEIFEKLQERKGLQEWEVQVLYLQRDYLQTCVEWFKGLDRDVQIEVAKANGTDIDQAYVDWHLTNA